MQALDSGGNAVPGVVVTLDIHSLPPAGGTYYVNGSGDNVASTPACTDTSFPYARPTRATRRAVGSTKPVGTPAWAWTPVAYCVNEDKDGTGILGGPNNVDYNSNGMLDPGDVAAVSPGQVDTDSTGYRQCGHHVPRRSRAWVQVKLTATTTVNGTQTTTTAVFWLPMLASYLTNSTVSPPGLVQPYGQSEDCADPN